MEFVEVDDDDDAYPSPVQLAGVRAEVQQCGAAMRQAAARGDEQCAVDALKMLERHRVLCAHRRGPRGVQYWNELAERWIDEVHPVVRDVGSAQAFLVAVGRRAARATGVRERLLPAGQTDGYNVLRLSRGV